MSASIQPAATHPLAGEPRVWADARPTKHEVAKHIIATTLSGRGYDDRITQTALADRVPVGKSAVRDLVAELREEGMAVVSFGSGYFEIQTDERLREAMRKQERARERARRTQQQLASAYYGGETA